MKKMYILALAALAMAFSCQKTEKSPEPASEPVVRTFTCTFAQPDTKLAINDADGKTTWEVGDQIMIHGGKDGADRQLVTLTDGDISANGKWATITVTIDPYDRTSSGVQSKYYAQYPGSLVPDGNMYYECCFNATNDKLMAACDVDGAFVFYNLCGIISYKVSGGYDQVVFRGNNDETVGYSDYYQVRIRKDDSEMITNYFKPGNGFPTNTPAKTITASVVADGSTVNTICIPNPSGFTSGFTMNFLKEGVIKKTLTTSQAVTLAHGQYRPMGDVTSYLKDYVPDTPPATNHYKDLGTTFTGASALDGSANSYIITSNGTYTFKAVEGNDTATELTTIASVAVLWETQNTASAIDAGSVIASADYHYKSGETPYIVFSTPGTLKAGNALIAAKDDHNDIIWSWHIWIPSTTINNVDAGFAGTNAIMDRNLGALEVTPAAGLLASNGLYYQWGRKDPLCGTHIKGSVSLTTTVASQAASMAVSIKNPTTFYYMESSDWCAVGDANRWDNAGAKTKYDPCPPGYKVPGYNSSLPMWNKSGAKFSGDGVNWSYTQDQSCKYNTATTAFPLPGYVNGNGQSESGYGKRELVWSSKAYDSKKGNCMLIRENAYNAENQAKSSGGNVRCIVE